MKTSRNVISIGLLLSAISAEAAVVDLFKCRIQFDSKKKKYSSFVSEMDLAGVRMPTVGDPTPWPTSTATSEPIEPEPWPTNEPTSAPTSVPGEPSPYPSPDITYSPGPMPSVTPTLVPIEPPVFVFNRVTNATLEAQVDTKKHGVKAGFTINYSHGVQALNFDQSGYQLGCMSTWLDYPGRDSADATCAVSLPDPTEPNPFDGWFRVGLNNGSPEFDERGLRLFERRETKVGTFTFDCNHVATIH